jgi:hypothetical protein
MFDQEPMSWVQSSEYYATPIRLGAAVDEWPELAFHQIAHAFAESLSVLTLIVFHTMIERIDGSMGDHFSLICTVTHGMHGTHEHRLRTAWLDTGRLAQPRCRDSAAWMSSHAKRYMA